MLQQKIRTRNGNFERVALMALVTILVALPATAAVFTVTLTNGATIDTRYRPTQSAADEGKLQLMTEHGNWITLPKSVVSSIESDFEARGYGTVLDTDTIVLGYSINDLPVPSTDQTSPGERLMDFLRGPQQAPFSVDQFVEPNSPGGIPIGFTTQTTPPISSRSGEPPVVGEN